MFGLMLTNGDLVVGGTGEYRAVSGTKKVAQDLRGALLEPLGNDRFHPGWGSELDGFVGIVADEITEFEIQAEVNRVIGNYLSVQRDKVEQDSNSNDDTRFTTAEIVSGVSGVSSRTTQDSVRVAIALSTLSGETVILNEVV